MGKLIIRVILVGASLFMIGKGIISGCVTDRSGVTCWADNHVSFLVIIGVWVLVGLFGIFGPLRD